MVQDPGGAGLLLEPPQPVRISREGSGKHLDRHVAPQPRVLRAIHLSHAPRAERREDLVGPEPCPGQERHREDSVRRRISRISPPPGAGRP